VPEYFEQAAELPPDWYFAQPGFDYRPVANNYNPRLIKVPMQLKVFFS
jgi:hypothetical protein